MKATLCIVCRSNPPKYKCSQCSAPYCALACYKTHQETHKTSAIIEAKGKEPHASISNNTDTPLPETSEQEARVKTSSNPSKTAEIDQAAVRALLKRQPRLRRALRAVFQRTIQPEDGLVPASRGSRGRGRGRGRGGRGGQGRGGYEQQRPRWTQERGDASAARMLTSMRLNADAQLKDALLEFRALVRPDLDE